MERSSADQDTTIRQTSPNDVISRRPSPIWIAIAALGVIIVQVVYGFLVFYLFGPNMDTRGQFGDIFGGVTALFTGLAFAGVIYTILLQRRELELQREELRLSRNELRRAAEAQLGSQKALTEQAELLKQSANLSAMTTLVNVYGRLLEPFWEATQRIRREIALAKAERQTVWTDFDEKRRVDNQLTSLQLHLTELEGEWSDTLRKHGELVSLLEGMIDEATNSNSTDTGE